MKNKKLTDQFKEVKLSEYSWEEPRPEWVDSVDSVGVGLVFDCGLLGLYLNSKITGLIFYNKKTEEQIVLKPEEDILLDEMFKGYVMNHTLATKKTKKAGSYSSPRFSSS